VATSLTGYRVFIASPGGLLDVRKAFRAAVSDYNDTDATQRGVLFIPMGWEDTLAGAGRPQGIINEDLRTCDYFVLVVWDRWGTPTDQAGKSKYASGTEEEFFLAESCYKDEKCPMRQIITFFKSVDPRKLSDPGEQLSRVLEFKRELEAGKRYLFSTFDEVSEFEQQLRRHLAKWVRDHEQNKTRPAGARHRKTEAIQAMMPLNAATHDAGPISSPQRNPLVVRARELAQQGRVVESETAYARAIARGNDPDAFNSYGELLQQLGRLSQAQVMFERVLELSDSGDETEEVATGEAWKGIAYGNLGELYRLRGDLPMAEKMHLRALNIAERQSRPEGMAIQYGKLGRIYRLRADWNGAESMHRKALELDLMLNNLAGTAVDYADLAHVFRARKQLDQALAYLERALGINEQLGLELGIAIVCGNLGTVYLATGDFDKAEAMHRRSLEIDIRLDHQAGMAIQYGSLSKVSMARGDLDQAEDFLRTSLAINERLGLEEGIAEAQRDLGYISKARGDVASARGRWIQSRDRFLVTGRLDEVSRLDIEISCLDEKAARV